MAETERKQVGKIWGSEDWVINTPLYCGKILTLREGWESSLHYHPKKHETMVCIGGKILVEVYPDGEIESRTPQYVIMTGEDRTRIILPPNTKHRFSTPFGEGGEMVEFSTMHDDEDVVRLALSHPLENLNA